MPLSPIDMSAEGRFAFGETPEEVLRRFITPAWNKGANGKKRGNMSTYRGMQIDPAARTMTLSGVEFEPPRREFTSMEEFHAYHSGKRGQSSGDSAPASASG